MWPSVAAKEKLWIVSISPNFQNWNEVLNYIWQQEATMIQSRLRGGGSAALVRKNVTLLSKFVKARTVLFFPASWHQYWHNTWHRVPAMGGPSSVYRRRPWCPDENLYSLPKGIHIRDQTHTAHLPPDSALVLFALCWPSSLSCLCRHGKEHKRENLRKREKSMREWEG